MAKGRQHGQRHSFEHAYRIHACRRMQERYNIFDPLDQRLAYERHLSAIFLGTATAVAERVGGKQIMRILDGKREFFVGYDPKMKLIHTYITRKMAEMNVMDPDENVVSHVDSI